MRSRLKLGRISVSTIVTITALVILAVGVGSGVWTLASVLNYVPELIMAAIISSWVWALSPRVSKIVRRNHYRTNIPLPGPVTLSNTVATPLPVNLSNGSVTIYNPPGNAIVLVGGLAGESDRPYFLPDHVGVGHGTNVNPGQSIKVTVTKNSRLSAIAQRNGDVIVIQSILSD